MTVSQLAAAAGVSVRTLRYYDQIGLLKPAGRNRSGYRIYGQREADLLQHILFYREMDMDLHAIRGLITSPDFSRLDELKRHKKDIQKRISRLNRILATVELSIKSEEKGEVMKNSDKFKGFIEQTIEANTDAFGEEVKRRWGEQALESANMRLRSVSDKEYADFEILSDQVLKSLKAAAASGDPRGEAAHHCADLHRRFLEFWWEQYTPEAHMSMVRMYLDDQRFSDYYEKACEGGAAFLYDAVVAYLRKEFDFSAE